jgi:hypothetical protein
MTGYSPPQFAAAALYACAWERAPSLRPETQLHLAANRESLIFLRSYWCGAGGCGLLTPSVVTMLPGFWHARSPSAGRRRIKN